MQKMRWIVSAVAACALLAGQTTAAQTADRYPSKPIRIIVGTTAGASPDVLARLIGAKLGESWKQPVVVENRPGGNFVIAAEAAARSPADGYTLFLAIDSIMTMNPLQIDKLPYDPVKDFAPISLVAAQSMFMVASAKAPGKSLKELLAYAKANPGKVNFAASVLTAQLIGEQIKLKEGIDMQYVPFKGPPPMLQALLNGEVDFAITTFVPYANYVKEGRLRGLAVTGTRRDSPAPDAPTLTELGYPEFTYRFWLALFAPAGTPAAALERLNAETNKALNDPEMKQRLAAAGLEAMPSTPAALSQLMRDDLEKWTKVVRAAKIKLGN